jgi:hypothetical protein
MRESLNQTLCPVLLDLPECRSLFVDFHDVKYVRAMNKFWEGLSRGKDASAGGSQQSLPKLARLSVCCRSVCRRTVCCSMWGWRDERDLEVIGESLLGLLERRSEVGLPRLAKLGFISCYDLAFHGVFLLRRMVSAFSFLKKKATNEEQFEQYRHRLFR